MKIHTRKTGMSLVLFVAAVLAGCQTTTPAQRHAGQQAVPAPQKVASVDFRLAQAQAGQGLTELKLEKGSLWVLNQPVLTRADLASIEPRHTQQGQPYLRFGFSQKGAEKLAAISQRYPGKILVVTVDNALIALPRIEGKVSNGVFNVPVASDKQALDIARRVAGQVKAG